MENKTRKPTRLPGFDYSTVNYYFVTICTKDKQCLFGTVKNLSQMGKIAKEEMQQISNHHSCVHIEKFIIMPNHVHAIIVIENGDNIGLDKIIGLYKSGVTRKIRELEPDKVVWQRSFHDRIIRNQQEYEKIWTYIHYNHLKWESDCFYTAAEKE